MNPTAYVYDLDFDTRYRVHFVVDQGKVIEFVVQLEHVDEGRWMPVVRYDTAHGFAHRDRYQANGSVSRHELLPAIDYNDALTFALRDLRANWQDWIRPFREGAQ